MTFSFSVDLGFPLEAFVMLSAIPPPLRLQYDLRLFAARGLCLILVELHFFFPESLGVVKGIEIDTTSVTSSIISVPIFALDYQLKEYDDFLCRRL